MPERANRMARLLITAAVVLLASCVGMRPRPLSCAQREDKQLVARLRRAATVQPSPGWGRPSLNAEGDTSSELLAGRGYLMKLNFSNWPHTNGIRDHRLHGYMHLAIAEGDIRYDLRHVNWTRIRDSKGNDLIPRRQRQDETVDPQWWRHQKVGGEAVRPDQREWLINFDLQLPDLSVDHVRVIEGVVYVLLATQWDTVLLDLPPHEAAETVFPRGRLGIVYDAPSSAGGYLFRLVPRPGFELLPHTRYPHFLAFEHMVGNSNSVWRYFDLFSYCGEGWKYHLQVNRDVNARLRLDMLTGVAVVAFPFRFHDVPLPKGIAGSHPPESNAEAGIAGERQGKHDERVHADVVPPVAPPRR